METKEIRLAPETMEIEVREDGAATLRGYAVKWNMMSGDLGGFKEKFDRGAFSKSLRQDSQFMFWGHDETKILGSTRNGSLVLTEDDLGLRFDVTLPDTQDGRDARTLINSKYIQGMSFGFRSLVDEWDETDAQMYTRTVKEARLFEVSPVAFPAYNQSYVSARQEQSCAELIEGRKARQQQAALRSAKIRENIIKNKEVGKL